MVEKLERPSGPITLDCLVGARSGIIAPEILTDRQNSFDSHLKSAGRDFAQYFKLFPIRDREKMLEWDKLQAKQNDLFDAGNNIVMRIKNLYPVDNSDNSILAGATICALKAARNVLLATNIDDQIGFAKKNGFGNIFLPLAQLNRLILCEDVFVKIGELSILDLYKEKKVNLADYYKFIVEASLARNISNYEKLTKNINNPMIEHHPEMKQEILDDACSEIAILSTIAPDIFNQIKVDYNNPFEKKIVDQTKDFIRKTTKLRNNIGDTVFKPNSDDFSEISSIMLNHIDESPDNERVIAVEKTGFNTFDSEKAAYRTAQRIIRIMPDHPHSVFYTKLANYFEKISENSGYGTTLTINDALSFMKESTSSNEFPTSSFEKIKDLIRDIAPKLETPTQEISFENKSLDKLKTPKLAIVTFPSAAENVFSVIFRYDDEKKRNSEIKLAIYGRKDEDEGIEWQFLESPNDPRMRNIKNILLDSTYQALIDIKNKVDIEHQEKLNKKIKNAALLTRSSIKINNEPYIRREKIEKTTLPKPLSPVEKALLTTNEPSKKRQEFKKSIIVSEKIENAFPKDMSKNELENLINKMKRLPEGLGDIRMLEITKNDKEPLYRAKFDSKHRMIIRKATPEETNNGHDGTQYYVLVKILRRNDDYKDLKKILSQARI